MSITLDEFEPNGSQCYLYWIYAPEHKDMFTEGYIGISANPKHRCNSHNASLRHRPKGYSNSFIKSFRNTDLTMMVIDCGTLYDMQQKEWMLRPELNIGYNVAIGGNMNGVVAQYKSGRVTDGIMYNRFIRLLNYCKDNNLYVDKSLLTDDGFRLFKLHFDIETNLERFGFKLINEDQGFVVGNVVLDTLYKLPNVETVVYKGNVLTRSEALHYTSVNKKTVDKRICSYGWTPEQAFGFEPPPRNNYVTIVLDGVECQYALAQSTLTPDEWVDLYEVYKLGKRDFKQYCRSLGVESANFIRYLKRYGLKSDVDRRTKKFRGGLNTTSQEVK